MKKPKIRWNKVLDLICLNICIIVLLHDVIMLIRGWTLTWIGLFTLIICCICLDCLYEDFIQIKSTQSHDSKNAKSTQRK